MSTVSNKSLYINDNLTDLEYYEALTNYRNFMKTLVKLPIYVAVIFIIILCLAGNSHAATYDPNVKALYSDKLIESLIKKEIRKHKEREDAGLSIKVQGHCVDDCVKPIDGGENSVQISDTRTSLPDEYLDKSKVDAITKRKGF